MKIEKTIATLEVTEDNKVILRERLAVLDDLGGEKFHSFEQRTIKSGDDYSQECDKVKAVCSGLFGLFPVEASVDDGEINSPDLEVLVDSDLSESEELNLDEQ